MVNDSHAAEVSSPRPDLTPIQEDYDLIRSHSTLTELVKSIDRMSRDVAGFTMRDAPDHDRMDNPHLYR